MTAELGKWLGIDAFVHPWAAASALVLTGLAFALSRRHEPSALPWPAWREASQAGGSGRDWVLGFSGFARVAVLALLGCALAGPVGLQSGPPLVTRGLDLALVVDTSGSMRALDTKLGGEWHTRLDLAREVVQRFAVQRASEGDRVALVVFGESAFTQCPLTTDARLLADALQRVEAGMAGEATALGDALALAVKRLPGPAETGPGREPGEGRLVVLLTDGRSNAGDVPPEMAARIAAARGVRVHTVGIGSRGQAAMAPPEGSAARGLRFERHDLDEPLLASLAATTGGRFFRAASSADLGAVYAAIDALERRERLQRTPRRVEPRAEPLLALAGFLLIAEIVTARGFARRLP